MLCKVNNFYKLLEIIGSEQNICLAYRNLKSNSGSKTAGTDGMTIDDIKQLSNAEIVATVRESLSNYRPKSVRRVFIPVWILSDSIFHLHDIRQLLHLKAQQNQILLTNAGMCCFVHFLNSMAIFARSYTLGSSFPIPTSFHKKLICNLR